MLAIFCVLSVALTSISFPISSKADGELEISFENSQYKDWQQVTFSDFGINDDTYNEIQEDNSITLGTYEHSLEGKVFSGNITFSSATSWSWFGNIYLGCEDYTNRDNGTHYLYMEIDDARYELTPENTGTTSLLDTEFNLKLSYDVVTASDETKSLKLGVWINDKLYDNQYIDISNPNAYTGCLQGNIRYMTPVENSYLTLRSVIIETLFANTDYVSWEQITFDSFGIPADSDNGTTYTGTEHNGFAQIGYYNGSSLAGKVFNGDVTLSKHTSYFIIGGLNDAWEGTYLISDSTEQLKFTKYGSISTEEAVPGERFNLKLSYDVVEADGTKSLKLGIWINNKLHNNKYIEVSTWEDEDGNLHTCEEYLGPYMSFYTPNEASYITVACSIDIGHQETNERYNLADGPYLISGTGTILVNGQVYPNGSTLTEPGVYRIESANGNFVRNVELYNAGKESSALTYGDKVMPIVGFYGPHSNDYNNYVTDNIYTLLEEAGINLISYIPKYWSVDSHQSEILRNLRYAEAHNIGVYVGDETFATSGTTATETAQIIAPYSQYGSFKGIFIADEPGIQDLYYPKNSDGDQDPRWTELWLDECLASAKGINGYCNLNGYINLFPYATIYGEADDYRDYMEQYITETEARVLSYDNYVFETMNVPNYFQNLSLAREKSLQHDIPFWPFVQAGNWKDPETLSSHIPTQGQFLWNVNTSLAYGAKGIQYYTLIMPHYDGDTDNQFGIIDKEGTPTEWYPYAQKANRQIAAIDDILMEAESKAILAIGEKTQSDTGSSVTSYGNLSSVTIGNAKEEGTHFENSTYADWTQLTFSNWEIENGTCDVNHDRANGFRWGSLKDKVFNGNVKFTSGYGHITIGGTEYDSGLQLYSEEGQLHFVIQGVDTILNPDIVGTELIDNEFNLKISYDMIDSDGNRTDDTLRLGIWINNILCWFDDITNYSNYVGIYGSYMSIYTPGESATITVGSPTEGVIIGAFEHEGNEAFYVVNHDTANQQTVTLNFAHAYKYRMIQDAVITSGEGSTCTLTIPAGEAVLVELDCGMKMQVQITDSIAMHYLATIEESEVNPTMTFTMEGDSSSVVVDGVKVEGADNTYRFTYSDIRPQHMAKAITATLNIGNAYTKTYEHSVLGYCQKLLEVKEASTLTTSNGVPYTDEQLGILKELVVDLIEYGEKVQSYGKKTGQLDAVDDIDLLATRLRNVVPGYAAYDLETDTELLSLDGIVSSKVTGNASEANTFYRWTGVTLAFKDTINLRGGFKLLKGANVEDFTMMVSIDNSEAKAYGFVAEPFGDSGELYVDFSDIYANEFSKTISITFYCNGVPVGNTLNYSVNTYLQAKRSTGDVGLQKLLLAINEYGNAAVAFKSSMMP